MGKDYVEQHLQDYQVIAIDTQGKVLISDSLKNQFQLSEEAASQYQIEGTKMEPKTRTRKYVSLKLL